MNQRNRRPEPAAPRQTPTPWTPDEVDAVVVDDAENAEDVEGATVARPQVARGLAPYAQPYGVARRMAPRMAPPELEWDDEPHALSYPFPRWLTVGIPVALALTLVAVYLGETKLIGGDWATGALAVSFTAFALVIVTVGVLVGRIALGRRAFGAVALGGLLALSLVASGLGGVALANPLRRAQASQAESTHNWQLAINEYTQAGEKAPTSADLARIYTEWGEAALARNDYATATNRLTMVVNQFASSGPGVVARARADLFKTYGLWITSGAITLPFKQSLDFLAAYNSDPACDSACQRQITNLSGQAHFQYGQQLVKAQQYKPAISEFELVQSTYATSSFVAQAHTAAAGAYWSLGQELLTQDCVTAIPYYNTLATRYKDTSQGKQAQAALLAPVAVKGVISGAPTSPVVKVYLSRHVDASADVFSDDYRATFDAKSGAFSFARIPAGSYYLTTSQTTSTRINFTYYPALITVGHLCAVQLPNYAY